MLRIDIRLFVYFVCVHFTCTRFHFRSIPNMLLPHFPMHYFTITSLFSIGCCIFRFNLLPMESFGIIAFSTRTSLFRFSHKTWDLHFFFPRFYLLMILSFRKFPILSSFLHSISHSLAVDMNDNSLLTCMSIKIERRKIRMNRKHGEI